MNFQIINSRFFPITRIFTNLLINRSYAKPAKGKLATSAKAKVGKAGPVLEKIVVPVEKDPHKLVNYVCGSNIYLEGEDIKLKPESEYPEWLWNIRTGPPPKLEEMDPNSREYWKRIRKLKHRHNLRLLEIKKRKLW